MWSGWLIPLIIYGATQSCHTHLGLSCVNDYITNITCEWNASAGPIGDDCTLKGIRASPWGNIKKECKLKPIGYYSNTTTACSINYDLSFSSAEKMSLQVVCNKKSILLMDYKPSLHVKLRWPDKPIVVRENITWSPGSRFPNSIKYYEFQLQVKRTRQSWEEVGTRHVPDASLCLDQDSMVLGESYEARVRVKPVEPSSASRIQGQWSDWSPSVIWVSDIGVIRTVQETPTDYALTLGPRLLVVITGMALLPLIICIACTYKCVLKKGGQHIPDPSKYFQPLLSHHGGNFQKWLGPLHSDHSYLNPQFCTCDISPVEISTPSDSTIDHMTTAFFQTNQMALFKQTSGNSLSLSSGISNMGYFYSELKSGSLCLESCPVYFTYQPEGGRSATVQSASSYECLQDQCQQQREPLSPDSGLDMGEKEAEEDSNEEEEEEEKGMCRGVNFQHLVSFVLSVPESSKVTSTAMPIPMSLDQQPDLSPWPEDMVPEVSNPSEPAEGAVDRPLSMVVQPCTSGYLSLKEMQKYSNKSI